MLSFAAAFVGAKINTVNPDLNSSVLPPLFWLYPCVAAASACPAWPRRPFSRAYERPCPCPNRRCPPRPRPSEFFGDAARVGYSIGGALLGSNGYGHVIKRARHRETPSPRSCRGRGA